MFRKFLLFLIVFLPLHSFSGEAGYIDKLKKELISCPTPADSVDILCKISWNSHKNKQESLHYGKLAANTAERISDSLFISHAFDALGVGYFRNDSLAKAKNLLKKAIEISERNGFKNRTAWTYYNLSLIAGKENNRQERSSYLRKAINYFRETNDFSGERSSYWFFIKTGQTNYKDTLINALLKRIEKSDDNNQNLDDYIELSRLYSKTEEKNKELQTLQKIIDLADLTQNTKASEAAYISIASYFKDYQQNYAQALTFYLKALELEKKENRKIRSELLSQIGETYIHLDNDSLGFLYLNNGLEISKKSKQRHSISTSLMSLGEMHYQLGNYSDAINYFGQCYKTGCDVCPQITFHDALVKIGNAYCQTGDYGNARNFYDKSLTLAKNASNKRALSITYIALGDLAIKQNQSTDAENFYSIAYKASLESNFINGQQESAEKLSFLYKELLSHQKAFDYLSISTQLADSISKISEAENLAKLETHFDFENLRMENELEKLKSDEEISRQKLLRNFFIGGVVLLTLLILLIYKSYKQKNKDNLLLEKQKAEIESMSKKVHEADQAKLDFFTNVSHELKTPLTIILGMTERLEKSLKEKQQLSTIRKNSLKLLQLINHLLDLRKLDTSNIKLQVSKVNLQEFLKGQISSFQNLAAQKNVELIFEESNESIDVYFDRDKIEKVISNLLSNAIKFNVEGGWVKLSAFVDQISGIAHIMVSDGGIGISQKDQKNIFNRFFRASEQNKQGSGIGLAYTKELTELHKGIIHVKSALNEGATFTVSIPALKDSYNEHEISVEDRSSNTDWSYDYSFEIDQEEDNSSIDVDLKNKTILIVEDNNDLRKYIASIFKNDYQVIEAEDGEKGVSQAQNIVPDIIISDVVMPKLSGLQLIEKLKTNPTTSHIPIILLTAKNDISTRLIGFEKGADEYINKPFDSAILQSRVENLLRLRTELVQKFSKQFHLQPREILIEDSDKKFIQDTIDVIEKHISNPSLNIDLLTIELGVNRTQLYRKLKALTDYSANQFIRVIRLKRAAQLLEKGQHNIAEVMDETGFNNYSYFNSCFKELFGKSPKEYALVNIHNSLN